MKPLLVVIPVWPGDVDVVRRNLERQRERDGQSRHVGLIALDHELVPRSEEFADLAKTCFSRAFLIRTEVRNRIWPEAQNRVWQQIARVVEHVKAYECIGWFMWESDALPLKKGWIDTLCEEYHKHKKPFMGHVVPNRGHMNAVAVYPPNISRYCEKAMIVKSTPFDTLLSKEVKGHIAPANHLIAHRLKDSGGGPSIPMTARALQSLPETTVIAHGYCENFAVEPKVAVVNQDRKKRQMNETSKAMRRRRCEEAEGGFKWSQVFKGAGVDVGAGSDPVQIPGCKAFDVGDGDANHLSQHFAPKSLDYVHASQCLEHMVDPRAAILDWSICVKRWGWIVVTVPDFDLYEKRQWPSRFNPDHKSAWSMWRKADAVAPIIHVPTFVAEMAEHGLRCHIMRLVDTNYDWTLPDTVDQTLPEDGCEVFVEAVFQKQ